MKNFLAIFFLVFTASCKRDWSYKGSNGPKNWGSLKEEYKFCKIGYNQSPIDIKNTEDYEFKTGELSFSYSLSDVEKERKNFVQNLNFSGNDFVLRGKKKYALRKMAFHHPSEHLVNGKPHSLELQIAHKSDDEQWLVVAVFLEIGKKNPAFDQLIEDLKSRGKNLKFNLGTIISDTSPMFFYDGSLTIPPCTEGYKWYVMKTPLQISKEQMDQIIKLGIFTKSNARPVQEFHPEKF